MTPLSIGALAQLCRDAEHLTVRYGSTTNACARLEELERAHVELQSQVATLQQKLNMALVAAAAAQVDSQAAGETRLLQLPSPPSASFLDVDTLLGFLQRHCACRGDLGQLHAVLRDFQLYQLAPETRFPPRDVLISVHEIRALPPPSEAVESHQPTQDDETVVNPSPVTTEHVRKRKQHELTRLTPKAKTTAATATATTTTTTSKPGPRGAKKDTSSTSSPAKPTVVSNRRARQEQKQATSAAATLSAMSTRSPPANGASTTASASVETPSVDNDGDESDMSASSQPPAKRKRLPVSASELVVKQILELPHDKRNIVELKQCSSLLQLETLHALNQEAPWDDVYRRRAMFSHILDYATMDERGRKWFLSALRVQFVWRREFWERLHWLPMSDAVCVGPKWEKYRQTRKRRANKAIAAWRKVYGDSLELMRQGVLPSDVWCDVSLWYMPATPLNWLPKTGALSEELREIDVKHPVRSYYVGDIMQHPFYRDDELCRKYPNKHEVPSPQLIALHQQDDKESARVNITTE
ncbi:hypothetical protein Poli38472_013517 [Pythium oligandrum]|uniref:Uncharacterized protein n=1 Tax=Pythium oligandrum TaxID=41045 RepID=A0A8K1C8A0_PYTOL|nr:hypothetical protein Poli38472_013517 [Pythium oligandrum]|eukprot:TMW58043.1 hypothetical protein Poli38472_013517 [Pythium oligandrum]